MEKQKQDYGSSRFSAEDLKALATIKAITKRGENAEVRQQKDGQLYVWSVSKKKESYS